MVHLIFVYGTLRNDATHQMAGFLKKFASFVGPAKIKGKLYLVENERDFIYPALVFHNTTSTNHAHAEEQQEQEQQQVITEDVHGDVFQLKDHVINDKEKFDEIWKALDEYEGPEYNKEIRKVTMKDSSGTEVDANIYVYAAPTKGMRVIKNGDFLRREL